MMPDEQAAGADPSQIIAELKRERDDALAREAAIAEVLQVINSSPGHLGPVFNAMLDKALRLCGAGFGIMSVYDGERFQRAAARGIPLAFEEWREANPIGLDPTPMSLKRLLA